MANTDNSFHEAIGKANYAVNPLTVEDIVNYTKSEGLGRIWQKIKLAFSGRGFVSTEAIGKMLLSKNVTSVKTKIRNEVIEKKINLFQIIIKDEVKKNVRLGNTTKTIKPINEEQVMVNVLSKTISSWAKLYIDDEGKLDVEKCVSELNSFQFKEMLKENKLEIDSYFLTKIIEEGWDEVEEIQHGNIPQINDKNQMESVQKLAKQINNLSDAIRFLH
ncbi:MAG: hypothetical protein H0T62_01565 [Parachlamydiaceae bacterium]|nr:hypothetical protein [Parachlamydiaceae bacterium]